MSFGITVRNDDQYIQIDSDTPRLCALFNGTYLASGSHVVNIIFPESIPTIEPPCIFIQNTPTQPNDQYAGVNLLGSPGNWYGAQISAANVNMRPAGKWFAAVFAVIAQADYGMRIWDANSKMVFDSGSTPITVTRAGGGWYYAGQTNSPGVGIQSYYESTMAPSPMLSDEYFMLNPFSRNILHPQPFSSFSGVRYNYSTQRLGLYVAGTTVGWADIGYNGCVFARLPGT